MVRIILGVIVGFIAWSIVWVGSEQILSWFWPAWYGAHQAAFEMATYNNSAFTPDTRILVMNIIRGSLVSIMSGFLAAMIAGERGRSTMSLGILLLAFGVLVAALTWAIIPLWYHIIFTAMLIPMTILGGKLKKAT